MSLSIVAPFQLFAEALAEETAEETAQSTAPVLEVKAADIDSLITQLGHTSFPEREKATLQLAAFVTAISPTISPTISPAISQGVSPAVAAAPATKKLDAKADAAASDLVIEAKTAQQEKNAAVVLDRLATYYFSVDTDPEIRGRCLEQLRPLVRFKLFDPPKGFLGIRLLAGVVALPDGRNGACVTVSGVTPGHAAARDGLMANDAIIALDDLAIGPKTQNQHFIRYIQSLPPGRKVKVTLIRQQQHMDVPVVLDRAPEHATAPFRREKDFETFFETWLKAGHGAYGLKGK